MQVIFIQEAGGIKRDSVKEVSDGYALNYLLPRGLAVRATPEKLIALAHKSQSDALAEAKTLGVAGALAGELNRKVVTMAAKAASSGKLYAGLTRVAVAQAIETQFKLSVDAKQLEPTDHLKVVGDHVVVVKLYPNVTARLIVRITAA